MTHKHKFYPLERLSGHPIYKYNPTLDLFRNAIKIVGWAKPKILFACICGKTKTIEEKS